MSAEKMKLGSRSRGVMASVAGIENMERELETLRKRLAEAEKRAEAAEKREALTEASNSVLRHQVETMGPALLRAQADRAAVAVAMDRLLGARNIEETGNERGVGAVERIDLPAKTVEEGAVIRA